jgi:hypothetical protein
VGPGAGAKFAQSTIHRIVHSPQGPEIDVRRNDLVYDLPAGATLRYKAWQLAYTHVRRSQEFAPPFGTTDGVHRCGSIALSSNLWRPSSPPTHCSLNSATNWGPPFSLICPA